MNSPAFRAMINILEEINEKLDALVAQLEQEAAK